MLGSESIHCRIPQSSQLVQLMLIQKIWLGLSPWPPSQLASSWTCCPPCRANTAVSAPRNRGQAASISVTKLLMLLRMLRLPRQIGNGRTHLPQRLLSMSCHLGMWRFSQRFSPCHRCHSQKHCHFFCKAPSITIPWWISTDGPTTRPGLSWAWTNESRTMNECRKTLSCCLLSLLPPSVSICRPVSSNLGCNYLCSIIQ